MYPDEIISEVWRIRDDYAAENHHDLREIVADLQRRQLHPHSILVDRRPNPQSMATPKLATPDGKAKKTAEIKESKTG
jgi:hypothetical protein